MKHISPGATVSAAVLLIGFAAATSWAAQTVPVGSARVDITPDYPVRLSGYAVRTTESQRVAQRIWAKALAIGADDGEGPALWITVENCGVPANVTQPVVARLGAKARIRPERIVICSTHTHYAPWLDGYLPCLSYEPLPTEQQQHRARYTRQLGDWIEKVVLDALAARRPAELSWAQGSVGFAKNRRKVKDAHCPGIGDYPQGPNDHSLPVLCAKDPQGKLVALVINYACHCTTLPHRITGFTAIGPEWPRRTSRRSIRA